MRTFLGFTSYYHHFTDGYSRLAVPLARLLKRESGWKAGTQLQEEVVLAFHELKNALIKRTLLVHVKPDIKFILDVDQSKTGVGACLQQLQDGVVVPLAFCSKTLGKSRQNSRITVPQRERCMVAFMQCSTSESV